MVSQSFNLIDQEEEELVAFGTRQSRVFTPQSRPNSRMEEMLSQLVKVQEEAVKSQDAMVKSLENRIVENTRFQEVSARALEAKVSELAKSQSELIQSHTPTDDNLSHIAYKQIEQIAEMSDLVDRLSTVERSLQGSPFTGSHPTRRSLTPPRHTLMASAPSPPSLTPLSSLAMERSKTAKASSRTTADTSPFTPKLEVTDETKSNLI